MPEPITFTEALLQIRHLSDLLSRKDAAMKAAMEALTFYADEANWRRDTAGCGPAPTMGIPGTSPIDADCDGRTARTALFLLNEALEVKA